MLNPAMCVRKWNLNNLKKLRCNTANKIYKYPVNIFEKLTPDRDTNCKSKAIVL
jgi:hypothetical protein